MNCWKIALTKAFVVAATCVGAVHAADFPIRGKPLRIIVGLPAGGPSDAQARVLGLQMSKDLGVPVTVENKPGGSMTIANMEVAKSAPDGHTILYAPSSALAQVPHTMAKISFDPFRDFTPISMGGLGPLVLIVHKSMQVRSVKELVAYGKTHPGQLNYASFGTGTSSHLFGEMFAKQVGLAMVHIPYKGSNDVGKDFYSQQVQLQFATAPSALALVKAGVVNIIGTVAAQRSPLLPDVPTMREQGITGLEIESWIGFFGPANLPAPVVTRLNDAIAKALASTEVQEEFRKGAWEPRSSTPESFSKSLRTSYEQWGRVVTEIGYKKE